MNAPQPGSRAGAEWKGALSDAVSRVMEEKAAAAAAARAQPKARRGALIGVGLALALVLGWNVWSFMSPGPLPPPDQQAYALRRSAGAVAQEALAIRAAEGALPDRDRMAHMLDDALTYQRDGDRFLVTNSDGEYVVTYDDSLPLDEWILNGGYRLKGEAP